MTRHILLNFSEVKQIALSSQFWATRWVRFASGVQRLPRGKQTANPWGITRSRTWPGVLSSDCALRSDTCTL